MRGRGDGVGALYWCISSGSIFCFGSCAAMTHPLQSKQFEICRYPLPCLPVRE